MLSPRLLLVLLPGALWTDNDTGRKTLTVKGRWVVVLLAVGVFLDLLISTVLISQNQSIRANASSVHIARLAAFEACQATNRYLAADQLRWMEITALLSAGNYSPELTKFIVGVNAANKVADQPRDCQSVEP